MPNDADDTKKQKVLLQHRRDSIRHLHIKGFVDVANDLRGCGCSYMVDICTTDINHAPKPIPLHCGRPICPDCAARESYKRILRYLPKLTELLEPNPDYPDYSLKHLVLTTPYALKKLTASAFKIKQRLMIDFLNLFFFNELKERGKLSPGEIRRGRCDLRKHMIGGIQSAEFGEKGKKLHWHVLLYSPFMPIERIWGVWRTVTGGECTGAKIYGLKPSSAELKYAGGDLLATLKEIVKYATKFTAIKPCDIPHLYTVLKGNRRFRAFGILYNTAVKEEKVEHVCEECGVKRDLTTVSEWLHICENLKIAPDDNVVDAVENGIEIYLSRYSSESSSGKPDSTQHKARDSIEGDAYV